MEAFTIGRKCLTSLDNKNRLKPAVFAFDQNEPKYYGVSLGVGSFLQPLYLYNKLLPLKDSRRENLNTKLLVTKKIRENIPLCASCQYFFNGSFKIDIFPFGNCAEFDALRNVRSDWPHTNEWNVFETSCQQHFKAYRKMLTEFEKDDKTDTKIIEEYCKSVESKVLKYRPRSDRLSDFELCVENRRVMYRYTAYV